MAAEQLPADQYAVGGQPTVTNYEVISVTHGFEEVSENHTTPAGAHNAKVATSRRKTLQLELEAKDGATPHAFKGALDASFVPTAVALDQVWKVRSATGGRTRGVRTVSLDVIALTDLIT